MGRYLDLARTETSDLALVPARETNERNGATVAGQKPQKTWGFNLDIDEISGAMTVGSFPGTRCEISEISEKRSGVEPGVNKHAVLLQVPSGCPEAWVQGVADLLAMQAPIPFTDARWQTLREDAFAFLRDWAAQAHRLGWTALNLFGAHRSAPLARFDLMGLVPALSGASVVALADDSAALRTPSGARQTFYRRGAAGQQYLVWDLGSRARRKTADGDDQATTRKE